MKTEEKTLPLTCFERTQALRRNRPPPWRSAYGRWREQLRRGVLYRPGEWFDDPPEALRQRFLRGIRNLERLGYLNTWARDGRRMSHVKLTATGLAAAMALVEQGQANANA